MNYFRTIKRYSLPGIFYLIYCKLRTLIQYPDARLIRRPIDIRGGGAIKIGKNFTTGKYCRFEVIDSLLKSKKKLLIGDNVQVNDSVHIAVLNSVIIGNNVLIASKVFISDHSHGCYNDSCLHPHSNPSEPPGDRTLFSAPVVIEENVWIGEFVSILPGVTIGRGSIIGTMSVVNSNIPANTIAVGVPAKVIKYFDPVSKKWVRIS